MSSSESEYDNHEDEESISQNKKRRIQMEQDMETMLVLRNKKACDTCKRKKIRCNGLNMSGNRCSNCIAHNIECTYIDPGKKRGHAEPSFKSLGMRLEKIETVLQHLAPNSDLFPKDKAGITKTGSMENRMENIEKLIQSLISDQESTSCQKLLPRSPSSSQIHTPESSSSTSTSRLMTFSLDDVDTALIHGNSTPSLGVLASGDDDHHLRLINDLKRLQVHPTEHRFFGKSSNAQLVRDAIDIRHEFTGKETDIHGVVSGRRRPEFWTDMTIPPGSEQPMTRWSFILKWENNMITSHHPNYVYPPPDLLHSLIDLYFTQVNIYLPLLHRPTFEKAVVEGLHLRPQKDGQDGAMFGATLLLVCAIASRYSDDERVLVDLPDTENDGQKGNGNWHSCGWKYFNQVQAMRKSVLAAPTLYDLQFYALSSQFLQGSSSPHYCWARTGIGIRMAQDIGIHRRRECKTVEDELLKRAFWVLVCLDRILSASLGRSTAVQDEDYDLDLPLEVDDEYWEHPDPQKRFRQPPGKPSKIAAFILTLRLNRIMGRAMRTIYAISKWRYGFSIWPRWEPQLIADLDSALNKWIDSVPEHLRWDPNRQDSVFFNQSVMIYMHYYQVRVMIHQPYLRTKSPGKPTSSTNPILSTVAFPSLVICSTAARSCIRVMEAHMNRNDDSLFPFSLFSQFTAAIILLLNVWRNKGPSSSKPMQNKDPDMEDIYKCLESLRSRDKKWCSSGRLYDVLYRLVTIDSDLPSTNPADSSSLSSFPDVLPDFTVDPFLLESNASTAQLFMEPFMDLFGPEFATGFDFGDSAMNHLMPLQGQVYANTNEDSLTSNRPLSSQPTAISPQLLSLNSIGQSSVPKSTQPMFDNAYAGTKVSHVQKNLASGLVGQGTTMNNSALYTGGLPGSSLTNVEYEGFLQLLNNSMVSEESMMPVQTTGASGSNKNGDSGEV